MSTLFRLTVEIENQVEFSSYEKLRRRIKTACDSIEGVTFEDFNWSGSPDPYMFEDPDDPPTDIE